MRCAACWGVFGLRSAATTSYTMPDVRTPLVRMAQMRVEMGTARRCGQRSGANIDGFEPP